MERNYRKRMGNGYGGASLNRGRARSGVVWLEGVKETAARLRAAREEPPKAGEFVWYTSSKVLPRLLGGVIGEAWSRWVFSPSHGGFVWLEEEPSSMSSMLEWQPGEWAPDETTNPVPGYASVFYLSRSGGRIRVRVPDSAIKRARAPVAPPLPVPGKDESGQRGALAEEIVGLCRERQFDPPGMGEWLKEADVPALKAWLDQAKGVGR